LLLWRWLTTRQTYLWFLEKRPKQWIREQADYYDEIAYSRELSLLYFLKLYGKFAGQARSAGETAAMDRAPDLAEDDPLWRRVGPRLHTLLALPWDQHPGDEPVLCSRGGIPDAKPVITDTPRERIGEFGRYQAVERFGGGAMAEVFHGVDPVIGREVAIKAMSKSSVETGNEDAWWRRFHQEAKLIGSLNHPNIVTVYDVGEQEGRPYIVMQFLEGEDLKSLITGKKELAVAGKVDLLGQVSSALDYAHRRGVIHRDLKPANIMIVNGDTAVLTDFGIAAMRGHREEEDGRLTGTVAYMAPEQIDGDPLDARVDIFALGVTAFELFYGRHPFAGPDDFSTIHRILQGEPDFDAVRTPDMIPGLEGILRRAMATDPLERYNRAQDFADALRTALAEHDAREAGKVIPLDGDAAGANE
jgi:tRNA A-37 threonylcarbamoyl transferase component Bud32